MYLVLRAKDLPAVAEALQVIGGVNAALRDYARARGEQLSTLSEFDASERIELCGHAGETVPSRNFMRGAE